MFPDSLLLQDNQHLLRVSKYFGFRKKPGVKLQVPWYNQIMKRIQYYDLQEKYAGKMVALNKTGTKVIAIAHRADQLVDKVEKQKISLLDIKILGPIQKAGSINVFFSISSKKN